MVGSVPAGHSNLLDIVKQFPTYHSQLYRQLRELGELGRVERDRFIPRIWVEANRGKGGMEGDELEIHGLTIARRVNATSAASDHPCNAGRSAKIGIGVSRNEPLIGGYDHAQVSNPCAQGVIGITAGRTDL